MPTFDEYFLTITSAQREEFERIRRLTRQIVPNVEEGVSYGLPAYLYKGKPFLSVMAGKKHLSLYPFSGKVLQALRSKLNNYEISSGGGSLHFTLENSLSKELLREIIQHRLREIDQKK